MSLLQIINTAIVSIGLPTLLGACIIIGKKLQVIDRLDSIVDKEIRPDLKDIRERFFALEGKASNFFQTASPVSLTPQGENALEETGLKAYLDTNKDSLIKTCENNKELKTAYDIQTAVFEFFDTYKFPEEMENSIKKSAYNLGTSPEILKRIGAIYFRKFCLDKHNFKEEDLDKGEKIKN